MPQPMIDENDEHREVHTQAGRWGPIVWLIHNVLEGARERGFGDWFSDENGAPTREDVLFALCYFVLRQLYDVIEAVQGLSIVAQKVPIGNVQIGPMTRVIENEGRKMSTVAMGALMIHCLVNPKSGDVYTGTVFLQKCREYGREEIRGDKKHRFFVTVHENGDTKVIRVPPLTPKRHHGTEGG